MGGGVREANMSNGLAIDLAEVLWSHVFWVGGLLLLVRLL
jgi:hypothetical protein